MRYRFFLKSILIVAVVTGCGGNIIFRDRASEVALPSLNVDHGRSATHWVTAESTIAINGTCMRHSVRS